MATPFDPEQYQNLFSDVFQTDPSLGLTSGAIGQDPGIGLAQTAAPVEATPPPAPEQGGLSGMSTLGKIGLVLQAFGAGASGETPLFLKLQQQELLKKKQRQQEMAHRLEVATNLSKLAAPLRGAERENFIKSSIEQYAEGDANYAEFLTNTLDRPDLIKSLPAFAMRDPAFRVIAETGDQELINKYLTSEAGSKRINQLALAQHAQDFVTKVPSMVEWHKKNNREEYDKIIADKKLTINELRRLHDALPIQLQATPESFSALTAPENQEALQGVMGDEVMIVTDKAAQKATEAALTGQHATEIQKLQGERDALQAQLPTATGAERTRLETKIKEINDVLKKRGTIVGRTQFDQLTTASKTELQRQLLRDDRAIDELTRVIARIKGDPARGIPPMTEATGVMGFAIEEVGGLLEQIPGIGPQVGEMLNSRDVTQVRTGMRMLVGSLISQITGDSSGRYSDFDVRRAEMTAKGLQPQASLTQTVAALETVHDIVVRGRARTAQMLQVRGDEGAAAKPPVPDKQEWLEMARQDPRNKNYSDEELGAFYDQKYGNR